MQSGIEPISSDQLRGSCRSLEKSNDIFMILTDIVWLVCFFLHEVELLLKLRRSLKIPWLLYRYYLHGNLFYFLSTWHPGYEIMSGSQPFIHMWPSNQRKGPSWSYNVVSSTPRHHRDLQLLPMQSVHIATNVVGSNPAHDEIYSILQHYVIKFVSYLGQVDGFLRVLQFLHQ